jgi:hypothetical protein
MELVEVTHIAWDSGASMAAPVKLRVEWTIKRLHLG